MAARSVGARRTAPVAAGRPTEAFRILRATRHGRPLSASITACGPVPILSATCCWSRTVSNRDCAGIVAFLGGGFARTGPCLATARRRLRASAGAVDDIDLQLLYFRDALIDALVPYPGHPRPVFLQQP